MGDLLGRWNSDYAGGQMAGFMDRLQAKGMTYEPGGWNWAKENVPYLKKVLGEEDIPDNFPNVMTDENGVSREMSADEQKAVVLEFNEAKDDWWRQYARFYTIETRNRLFGATLTPGEEASWESANINRGMTETQITTRLKAVEDKARERANKRLDEYESAGWDGDLLGVYRQQLGPNRIPTQATDTDGGTPEVSETQTPVPTVIPQGSPFPDLISPTDWDTLDDTDKAEAMAYADEYGPEALLELMSELTGTPAPSTPTSFPLTTGQQQSGRIQRNN